MFKSTVPRWLFPACTILLQIAACPAIAAEQAVPLGLLPSELQSKLKESEDTFKLGKTARAIEQASLVLSNMEKDMPGAERVTTDAKADLALYQLKAGHPDESAKLIRQLFLNLQLELPFSPNFEANSVEIFASAPKTIKEYFAGVIERLGESGDTRQIVESLIDNTYPKDYTAQLKSYSKNLKALSDQMPPLQSVADTEELKYADALSSLEDSENLDVGKVSAAELAKLGAAFDKLAFTAQQMPVGDARPAVMLYRLALLANSQKLYPQAEALAVKSSQHLDALADDFPVKSRIDVALAYALLQQRKIDEFKIVRDRIVQTGEEPVLVAAARLTEFSGDDAGALSIYKGALQARTKRGISGKPSWIDQVEVLEKKMSGR